MEKTSLQKLKKQISHDWTILCTGSSVDVDSKNISIYNFIEIINIALKPTSEQEKEKESKGWYSVPLNIHIVTRIRKNSIDSDLALNINYHVVGPDNKRVGKNMSVPIKFGKGLDTLKIRNNIGSFPVIESGTYNVIFSIGNVGEDNVIKIGESRLKINLDIKK